MAITLSRSSRRRRANSTNWRSSHDLASGERSPDPGLVPLRLIARKPTKGSVGTST